MSDDLFMAAADMATYIEWVGTFAGYGLGLATVVWSLGYLVWFIVDIMR